MNLNKRAKVFLIIGCIVMIATTFIFSLTRTEIILPYAWIGFITLIFAEFVFFFGLTAIECFAENRNQILIRAGGGTVLVIYSMVVFAISLTYINIPIVGIRLYWSLQIILFVIALILEIIFISISKSVYDKDKSVLAETLVVNDMISSLALLGTNADYKEILNQLAEDLRYSDISSTVSADADIQANIVKLEQEFSQGSIDQSRVESIIEEISALIKKRKVQIKKIRNSKT